MPSTRNLPEHTAIAAIHLGIAGWAVSAVVGGLIVTTGWRY